MVGMDRRRTAAAGFLVAVVAAVLALAAHPLWKPPRSAQMRAGDLAISVWHVPAPVRAALRASRPLSDPVLAAHPGAPAVVVTTALLIPALILLGVLLGAGRWGLWRTAVSLPGVRAPPRVATTPPWVAATLPLLP